MLRTASLHFPTLGASWDRASYPQVHEDGIGGFGVVVGSRPFPTHVQATDVADGGALSDLLPETELLFLSCCGPRAFALPLRTARTATLVPQKSCLRAQCRAVGDRQECR